MNPLSIPTSAPLTIEQALNLPAVAVRSTTTDPHDSDRSTADTIQLMRQLAVYSAQSPIVLGHVQQIMQSLAFKTSDRSRISAIYYWVKAHVQFEQDEDLLSRLGLPPDSEVLKSPEVLLSMPQPKGDCDCFSTLLASMLLAAGYRHISYVTIAADEDLPWKWSHVYLKVVIPDESNEMVGSGLYLDASHGVYPGWHTNRIYRYQEWPIL